MNTLDCTKELKIPEIKFTDNNNRPKFMMLVGLPGSGKTHWGQSICDVNTVHISSDGIRYELYGDANCQKDPEAVFKLMHERTLSYLSDGYNVIYDATNITRKNRKSILDLIPSHVIKECVIVWAPVDVCIERDSKRERTVGPEVIDKMLRRFEAPFYDEGFDSIWVWTTKLSYNVREYYADLMKSLDIPHDNPHHSAGVLEHCILCGEKLEHTYVPDVVKTAAYLHDIGKPYVKSFTDRKGEPTDIAHYYDHQAVGAWISYGLAKHNPTLAWLISSHMAPFINQKYYNSLDPYYKRWIELLHEADKAAH